MSAPTGWRIICAGAASAPRWWWGCAWSARRRWSLGCSAILKAGGAYLPLDPAYPRERLAFMLEDAGAPVLVTHSALAGAARRPPRRQRARRCRCRGHRRPARIGPRRHARPAPSRLCHLHLRLHRNPEGRRRHACERCQQAWRLAQDFEVGPDAEAALCIRLAGFDAAVVRDLLPLAGGGAAVVIGRCRPGAPSPVLAAADPRHDVTLASCVPSCLQSVIGALADHACCRHWSSAARPVAERAAAGDLARSSSVA